MRVLLEMGKQKRGVKHAAMPLIEKLGPEVAAYMTLRVCLDMLAVGGGRARAAAFEISRLMLDELRYRKFRKEAPALFKYRLNSFDTNNYAHKKRSLDATMEWAKVNTDEFELSDPVRLAIGMKMLDVFLTTTSLGYIDTQGIPLAKQKRFKGRVHIRTNMVLLPTEETTTWMDDRNNHLLMLQPVNPPMVLPPVPWGPGRRGGYRFGLRGKYGLGRGLYRDHKKAVENAEMPLLYKALNAIQDTGWRINVPVLSLIAQMTERQMVAGLADEPLPSKPEDIEESAESRRLWRRAASMVKSRNVQRKAERRRVAQMLRVAGTFSNDTIYFPCNLDFRGRVYPIPNYLNPQGDDMQKSLLLFEESVPLGEHGWWYLCLHGANCLDETPQGVKMSSLTLEERVAWIESHSEQIAQVARDPLSNLWWFDADQPFQFYAFAAEFDRIRICGTTGSRDQVETRLPVSQDGTCNGVQHFSALLRDCVGGASVNLLPSPTPADLYQQLCSDVRDALERDAGKLGEVCSAGAPSFPHLWLSSPAKVDRKMVKRPAMTFPYGSRAYGFAEQLAEYLSGLDNWEQVKQHFTYLDPEYLKPIGGISQACTYLAGVIWQCLQVRVVAAFNGMEWMRECVRLLASKNHAIEWTVPGTGLRVRQEYFQCKKRQIKTVLAGVVRSPAYFEETSTVRAEKQMNAISPNFIHSLDAAVLMHTVALASSRGVTSFAMVHDSFGTPAGHAQMMYEATREAFVEYYKQHNPVMSLFEEFRNAAESIEGGEKWEGGAEIPSPPAPGNLDIEVVRQSRYFFC